MSPHSPLQVEVAPAAGAQKVRAWGPGLHGGVVGRSADFVVEAIGTDVGTLGEGTGGGGGLGGVGGLRGGTRLLALRGGALEVGREGGSEGGTLGTDGVALGWGQWDRWGGTEVMGKGWVALRGGQWGQM